MLGGGRIIEKWSVWAILGFEFIQPDIFLDTSTNFGSYFGGNIWFSPIKNCISKLDNDKQLIIIKQNKNYHI